MLLDLNQRSKVVHNQQKADGSMPVNQWLICACAVQAKPNEIHSPQPRFNKKTSLVGVFLFDFCRDYWFGLCHATKLLGSKFVYKNKRKRSSNNYKFARRHLCRGNYTPRNQEIIYCNNSFVLKKKQFS